MSSAILFLSYILPIIFFPIFCAKKASKALWVIFIYLVSTFAFDYFQSNTKIGNENLFELQGLFTIYEFSIFVTFLVLALKSTRIARYIIIIAALVIIFIIINFIKSDKHRFDSTSASIESIALIVFSILFFFDLLNRPQPFMITALPEFWVVLAIMVYMSSTLFLFIIANISEREADKYWFINTISNIVSNIIFCIAFITNRYAQPNPPVEKPSL